MRAMATGRVQREQLASHDHGAVLKRALVQVPGDVRDVQDAEVQDGHIEHEHADVQLQLLSAAATAPDGHAGPRCKLRRGVFTFFSSAPKETWLSVPSACGRRLS